MKEDIIRLHKKLLINFLKIRTISAQMGNYMNIGFSLFYAFKTDDIYYNSKKQRKHNSFMYFLPNRLQKSKYSIFGNGAQEKNNGCKFADS